MKALNIHNGATPPHSAFADKFRDRLRRMAIGIAAIFSVLFAFDVIFATYFASTPEFHLPRLVAFSHPMGIGPISISLEALSGALIGLAAAKRKPKTLELIATALLSEILLNMLLVAAWSGPGDQLRVFLALIQVQYALTTALPLVAMALVYTFTRRSAQK